MTSTILSLLGSLFIILAIGVLLRTFPRRAPMGQPHADVLNALIVDVTMPALIIGVLSERDLVWSASLALVPATLALAATGGVALWVTRALGCDREVQGAAVLTSAFCNTGFLGFPLLLALFPGDATASSTALLVDTFDTTILLWTAGLACAQHLGSAEPSDARAVGRVLLRPLTAAVVLGVALRMGHIELPGIITSACEALGRCTSPLVFLSLGLQLDLTALKGRVLPVVVVSALKLALAPLLCLVIVRAMDLREPEASVVVLQCAMPSAMVSVIVAARAGCDRAFAAGVATVTTVLCIATLPVLAWLLERTAR